MVLVKNEMLKQIDELKSENQILKLGINKEKSNETKEDNTVVILGCLFICFSCTQNNMNGEVR